MHEDWKVVKLSQELFLTHCPNLPLVEAKDQDNKEWFLLGVAIQTEIDKKNPATEIENSTTEQVKKIYKSWAGRWLLIGNEEIHLDCCGLLGCFYTTISGEKIVSSSLSILNELGSPSDAIVELKWKSAVEWCPLPYTRFRQIRKLLPSQTLNLETFEIKPREFIKVVPNLSYEEIKEQLIARFTCTLNNLASLQKKVFLPLSSGRDSRLILAAAYRSRIKVHTFTQENPLISHADMVVPPRLAKLSGYSHQHVKMRKSSYSKVKEELYDLHTGEDSKDVERVKFAYGQWSFCKSNQIVLRGGVFDLMKGTNRYRKLKDQNELNIASMLKLNGNEKKYEAYLWDAYSEWKQWVEDHPSDGLDWRDRFYVEQRVAGWLSAIEQSLDLTDIESFYMANCHHVLSLFISIPDEKRRTFQSYEDLISLMHPSLLKYPFNQRNSAFRDVQSRLKRFSRLTLKEQFSKVIKKIF